MKKLFLVSLSLACVTTAFAAQDTDLRKGIDLTGRSSVTGSQMNQLVDNGTVSTNKGLLIVTNGTPNVAGRPQYTNFLWLDHRTDPATIRVYNAGTATWDSFNVAPGSVTTVSIADGAVTQPKIAANAVVTTNITDQSVTSAKIAPLNVLEANIANGVVTRQKIADGAIGASQLTNGAVTAASIAAGSIYGTNLVVGTITSNQIASGTVTGSNIGANTVTSNNVAYLTLMNTNIANGTITTNKLAYYPPEYYNPATNTFPASGAVSTFTHGLSGVPTRVYVTLRCGTANNGYSVGDEIDASQVYTTGIVPTFFITANASTIYVTRTAVATDMFIYNRGTGAQSANINGSGDWQLKVRAWFQP